MTESVTRVAPTEFETIGVTECMVRHVIGAPHDRRATIADVALPQPGPRL